MPTINQLVRKGRKKIQPSAPSRPCSTPARRSAACACRSRPDAEEAELRAAQDRARPALERQGDHRLHPRRGPQPAGALDRAGARRPRARPARCALPHPARHARRLGRRRPPAEPLASTARSGPRSRACTQHAPQLQVDRGPRSEPDPPSSARMLATKIINKIMLDGQEDHRPADLLRRARPGPQEAAGRREPGRDLHPRRRQHHARRSRCAPSASAAPTTRCRARCAATASRRSRSAGWSTTRARRRASRWPSASPRS